MSIQFDDMSPEDIKLFIAEADEQLELLESNILRMEQGDSSTDLMQEMFRAAHTLKGSSATLGHKRMTELAHAMENVMDKVRKNELAVSLAVTEALFVALDGLRLLKDEVIDGQEREVDLPRLVGQLNAVMSGGATPAAKAPAENKKAAPTVSDEVKAKLHDAAQACGGTPVVVAVVLSESCFMGSIRMFQVLEALRELGKVAASNPSQEDMESDKDLGHALSVFMATNEPADKIKEAVMAIAEIDKADVSSVEPSSEQSAKPAAAEQTAPAPVTEDRRQVDLGPAARGKSADELKKIAQKTAAQTVRVDVERLDNLMNLVGELVISRTRLAQLGSLLGIEVESSELVDDLTFTSSQIGRITQDLQAEILKARMMPVDTVFSKFPRMIRDLAQKAGKEVNFIVEGKETELDRSVIEVIGDPLIHILRNAADHGLEPPDERETIGKPRVGTIRLSACHEENHIVIRVQDDGKGIDGKKLVASAVRKGHITQEAGDRMDEHEALNLIFISGLSTAKVVSDISGRGVGMDIVKTNIEKLNGTLSIDTVVGKGSCFTVKLPLTLAIIQAMLVEVTGRIFAIPLSSVNETIKVEKDTVKTINNREVIVLRGSTLPLIWLKRSFLLTEEKQELIIGGSHMSSSRAKSDDSFYVVVVGASGKRVGFVVDNLVGKQEVVIKNMGRFVGDIRGFSGATILGNGKVALILDVPSIISDEIRERMTGAMA
ncbi:MAG: chemotaxis protein CheA [Nitrospirota bacterium]|nr:chemotaxis protein CheA [Nitrospirota bacterium]